MSVSSRLENLTQRYIYHAPERLRLEAWTVKDVDQARAGSIRVRVLPRHEDGAYDKTMLVIDVLLCRTVLK